MLWYHILYGIASRATYNEKIAGINTPMIYTYTRKSTPQKKGNKEINGREQKKKEKKKNETINKHALRAARRVPKGQGCCRDH